MYMQYIPSVNLPSCPQRVQQPEVTDVSVTLNTIKVMNAPTCLFINLCFLSVLSALHETEGIPFSMHFYI